MENLINFNGLKFCFGCGCLLFRIFGAHSNQCSARDHDVAAKPVMSQYRGGAAGLNPVNIFICLSRLAEVGFLLF